MMQAVHFRPGGPENLYLADVPLPELWSKHVHLRVIGTAINRADLLQRKGLYPPPQGTTNILGLEATGKHAGFRFVDRASLPMRIYKGLILQSIRPCSIR